MLKTLWPKYLLFKNKIEAINIEQKEDFNEDDFNALINMIDTPSALR